MWGLRSNFPPRRSDMAVQIAPHPEGATMAVRAQPNARKTTVVGEHGGALKVAVTAPPEDGRANEALVEVLRDWLGLRRAPGEPGGGHTGPHKPIPLPGPSPPGPGQVPGPETRAPRISA